MAEEEAAAPWPTVPVRKTLYCVRHGQALHNVLEDQVKEKATTEAQALGHINGTPDFEAFLKQARLDALSDENLIDPGLSDQGREQLLGACTEIQRAFEGPRALKKPTTVLVSPLLRAMQSAAILFPDYENVRVSELLRERKTGLPCDEVSPLNACCSEFSHMSLDDLSPVSTASTLSSVSSQTSSPSEGGSYIEDAAALRVRTAELAEVLARMEDDVVCVVSHKGWLRELERGPLGRPEAKEFKPGEVRVFDVALGPGGAIMDAALRFDRRGLASVN